MTTLGRSLTEAERCIAGNHDLGACGRISLEHFTSWAHDALVWTQARLGKVGMAKLDRLAPRDPDHAVPMFHASPRDPVWEYVVEVGQARDALESVPAQLILIGHTHLPSIWHHGDDGSMTTVDPTTRSIVLTEGRWLVNPGSVGQPRDGDPRASWALYDPDGRTIEIMRTPYDVAGAQNAILAAGLPAGLATRLSEGR